MALETHSNEIAPTLRTLTNWILICEPMKEETNKEPKICAMRGRADGEWHESANYLTKTMVSSNLCFRVRRLTERELFRLMDVSEEDIDKIQAAGISKTQQVKMAGNSIVVNVLYEIFRKMFVDTERETAQLELF